MRLWYFLSSVNSFFKHACAAIQWGRCPFLVGPFVCVCQQRRLWQDCAGSPEPSLVACLISTIFSWAGSNKLFNISSVMLSKTLKLFVIRSNWNVSCDSESPNCIIHHHHWVAAWQNQQNDLCTQQRLRSAWASESSLCTHWVAKDPRFLHADSENWSDWEDAQADLSLRWGHRSWS